MTKTLRNPESFGKARDINSKRQQHYQIADDLCAINSKLFKHQEGLQVYFFLCLHTMQNPLPPTVSRHFSEQNKISRQRKYHEHINKKTGLNESLQKGILSSFNKLQ